MKASLTFPIREVGGERWCSLANMGIKRIDVVAYTFDVKKKYSFAGGHRHRLAVVRDDIHIKFPEMDIIIDIQDVKPLQAPRRRHDHR